MFSHLFIFFLILREKGGHPCSLLYIFAPLLIIFFMSREERGHPCLLLYTFSSPFIIFFMSRGIGGHPCGHARRAIGEIDAVPEVGIGCGG